MKRHLTRRAILAGASLLTTIALAACGSDGTAGDEHGMPGMTGMSSASTRATAHNNVDVMFAQMMIPHHQQAVAMAALAGSRASDAEVKQLASQIKAAQDPEITTMNGWLAAWGQPTIGPSGTSEMPGMAGGMPGMMSTADMAKLTAATGKDFDKQFCAMMIAHHQGAITQARDEVAGGSDPAAKALAQNIITAQQAEIDQMNKILARL
jgi:uncharacterized protein (DUF305 family)